MSTDTIPSKLILTCTVTGKQVTWTNKTIIAAKIAQHGSLEAFVAQFKCKGANKKQTTIAADLTKAPQMNAIMKEGVELGKLSPEEYAAKHPTGEVPSEGAAPIVGEPVTLERVFEHDDGSTVTVSAPAQSGTADAIAKGNNKLGKSPAKKKGKR